MQLNTIIDDSLFKQARQLTGVSSETELLEYALRLVIASQSAPPAVPSLKRLGKAARRLGAANFESADMPPVYQGPPLSLEDMQRAIAREAERHK